MAEPQKFTDPQHPESRREHHLRTPTSQLSHSEKIARQQKHLRMLSIVLVAVLAMLVYAAIFDLDSAAEWIVFGAICFTAVGALVAVQTSNRG